jgi:hypothetical protein
MALARVVTFEGVGADRIGEIRTRMEGERPEGLPATEIMVLHDPAAETATAIVFFDDEAGYEQGNAVLEAMPASDTPGRRTSVTKCDVVVRRSA